MRRREFVTFIGGAAVAWPLAARAQGAERVQRIGILMSFAASDPEAPIRVAAFLQRLQELGWTDRRNVHIDYRFRTTTACRGTPRSWSAWRRTSWSSMAARC
jgi:hypothetical protein